MKTLLLTLLLIIPTLSFSQVITDGLVGYWPFNGNANDESGNGNDGSVFGADLTEDRDGNLEKAYFFNGTTDYINIDSLSDDIANNTTGSWSIWIKPSDFEDISIAGGLINFSSVGSGTNYSRLQGWILPNGQIRFYCYYNGTIYWDIKTTGVEIIENSWSHIALVQDGISPKIYINGQLVSITYSVTNDLTYWCANISFDKCRIGDLVYSNPTERFFFSGTIDDLRIYNKALTEQEVQLLYSEEVPNPQPSPELCQSIYCDGENVGIGTANTQGYKLAVAGDIITEKIIVATQINWPDYVFLPGYQFPSLEELERYINENKKLPGMPSATEVETEGVDLGEMNRLLLEKIEELTLFMIQQNETIEKLKLNYLKLNQKLKTIEEEKRN